jgi:hypothetical protein
MKPIHPIAHFMSHETFEQLYRSFRPYDPRSSYEGSFDRVSEWSAVIQQASLQYWIPGTNIAVDECIQHFEGRTLEKVIIKSKPTPEGFKIWAIAEAGYFLSWLPHLPQKVFDAVGDKKPRSRKRKRDEETYINPTQAVVINLVKRLPPAIYHVFLDNLFSSPDLFSVLRDLKVGATGTCRTNCGIFKSLAQLKKADNNGLLKWNWGQMETAPTPDNKVDQARKELPRKSPTNSFLGQSNRLEG